MTSELVSKRTRNEFREFLVGWTLREIEAEFESAGVDHDHDHTPKVSGQRRGCVEQHYKTLDFRSALDVRRLLLAYAGIIERAERGLPASGDTEALSRAIDVLKACLLRDGFAYRDGAISAATLAKRAVFQEVRTISEVTRRAIFAGLSQGGVTWSGDLSDVEVLAELYDLSQLPSEDPRFSSMSQEIWQHRESNDDWPDNWVFWDSRLDLLGGSDEAFLAFLCRTVHPVVRANSSEARSMVAWFNDALRADGWKLVEGKQISAKPTFSAGRLAGGAVTLPESGDAADVLSDDYVRELSAKCDARLSAGDLDGAVTVARTLLEAILGELEVRLAGTRADHKGDLPKQFKQVAKLLRVDDQRPDLDDRFKDVARGLVMIVSGLAPLRNRMSDGHARERKPAAHHARVIVNAAKTVSAFLVESFVFQRERGLLRESPLRSGS